MILTLASFSFHWLTLTWPPPSIVDLYSRPCSRATSAWAGSPTLPCRPYSFNWNLLSSKLIRCQDFKYFPTFWTLLDQFLFLYLHMAQPQKSPLLWSMQSLRSSCTSMHFAHLPNWRWQSQMRSVLMWGTLIGRRTGSFPDKVCLGHSFHCWHWCLGYNYCPHGWHKMSQW